MKTLITSFFFLLVFFSAKVNAQSTSTPDSVCAGATGKIYKISGTAGSTFQWIVNGGTQASGGTSDSITVNWSSTPGIDTLKVVEYNIIGCPGDTVRLAVVRLTPPTVTLSGADSICINSATVLSKLKMNFTGVAPWTVSYTEDGTTRNVTTSTNPYTFDSQVYTTSGIKGYAISTISGRLGCVGTYSGSAAVTVFPKPTTSAISHY